MSIDVLTVFLIHISSSLCFLHTPISRLIYQISSLIWLLNFQFGSLILITYASRRIVTSDRERVRPCRGAVAGDAAIDRGPHCFRQIHWKPLNRGNVWRKLTLSYMIGCHYDEKHC